MKKIIFIIAIIFSTSINAQDKKLSPNEYKSQLDSLTQLKNDLINLKAKYQALIDSLYSASLKMDTLVNKALNNKLTKKYGRRTGAKLAAGMVWNGMTEKMILDSWGKPDSSNTDKFSYGVFSQHKYGDITFFFRDGKLIDWEQGNKKESSDKPIKLRR